MGAAQRGLEPRRPAAALVAWAGARSPRPAPAGSPTCSGRCRSGSTPGCRCGSSGASVRSRSTEGTPGARHSPPRTQSRWARPSSWGPRARRWSRSPPPSPTRVTPLSLGAPPSRRLPATRPPRPSPPLPHRPPPPPLILGQYPRQEDHELHADMLMGDAEKPGLVLAHMLKTGHVRNGWLLARLTEEGRSVEALPFVIGSQGLDRWVAIAWARGRGRGRVIPSLRRLHLGGAQGGGGAQVFLPVALRD